MPRSVDSLNRHRALNAVTKQILTDDWPTWESHSSLIRFDARKFDLPQRLSSTHIIFPTTSIFSLSSDSPSGVLAESSLIGNEGLVGLHQLSNSPPQAMSLTLQTAGFGIAVLVDFLQREIEVSPAFRRCVLSYSNALVRYATQTCFCYRDHSIEQQIVKMILLTRRRTGSDEILMTHERIGSILGIRREAASTALGHLSRLKLVQQNRGRLVLSNIAGLESQTCECYSAICKILGYSNR